MCITHCNFYFSITCQRRAQMAAEGTDALKIYWDHFFKAETGTYEKSTWLDLFLAEFIIRVNNGANPTELIKFCPVSGVVTLVGCELLCGIHRVMSSINAHYSAPPGLDAPAGDLPDRAIDTEENKSEDARVHSTSLFTRNNLQSSEQILRKYLLGGVAWRCLVLLKALGVEGLSCCRQLSTVLILLFGELSGAPASEGAGVAPPAFAHASCTPRVPIHELFSHRIWSKQKHITNQVPKPNSAASSEKGSTGSTRIRRPSSLKFDTQEKSIRKTAKHSDQSSESGDSNDDLQILNRSLTIKVCTPNDDFEYFNSTRTPNDYPNDSYFSDPYYTPRKTKPKTDDYMNDQHREIINFEISAFHFTLIITDLLQELCKAESSLTGSEGSQISMQCINFSLRNLCSLQFTSVPQSQQHNTPEVSRIKVALTELLMVSLDQILIHSDLCSKLINNGILPMLLRILEDVISKSKQNKLDCQNQRQDETESENLLKFVFGIAYSVTAFFHCLLMQCRSVDKLREFTEQFKLYGECLKGGLLKDCIELMIRIPYKDEEVVILIKKLIETIGKLVSAMKRVRSEVLHSAACPRSRHKVCRQRVAAGMHHHHDVLGEATGVGGLPINSVCCVSVLYGTLTALLTDEEVPSRSVLRSKILKVMLTCGVCCCFSPGVLMESIVRLMLKHNGVASTCLQVLEHTVYGELGAGILYPKVTDQLPCSICEPTDEKRDLGKKYCSHGVGPIDRKSTWSFLYHYNSLLQLDNHNNVLHATVSHLLRVTPKCRMEMKYELLFSVIYPTFIVAKHRYIIRLEDSAYFLTVSCLNIFTSLLNTVPFAEQFIQKGGLSYVLELVSLPEFSTQCCSILEIAIIVEIFKLTKDNPGSSYFREMSSLASVQMLFKSLSEMSANCYKIYKTKLPRDQFEELVDVSAEREGLGLAHPSDQAQGRKMSAPMLIKTNTASTDTNGQDCVQGSIAVLKNAWTFWRSCATLCLCSPAFRVHVSWAGVLVDSYALLKLALGAMSRGGVPSGGAEMRALVNLVEALLTVQLAVADVTAGRSKEVTCRVVRAALAGYSLADEGVGGGEGGALRPVCEALIRVATAAPSRRHAMPRHAPAKVPPLQCAGGGVSSAEGSSSEDSAIGPYASDHSDSNAVRPDDGYEADVEVGNLDLQPLYRNRKLSASLSTIMSGLRSLPTETMSAECGEYTKTGDLAHPELCIIVVDVLTQLIHKVLASKESEGGEGGEGGEEGIGRAGSALARACCARLAAALGPRPRPRLRRAAPPAPPALLRRLLAPAAHRLLTTRSPRAAELQRSILELIQVVAAQSIEPPELASFLKLFTAENPPLSPLLATLQRLVHSATHNTPDCILTFPVDSDNQDGVQTLPEELGYVVMNSATSQSHQAENCAKRLHESHRRAGVQSPWSCHALRCGVEGAGWAPWLAGFALTAWLHTQAHPPADSADAWDGADDANYDSAKAELNNKKSPTRKESKGSAVELSHVVSVGHESLMFEMWLDTPSGTFTFRLTRPEASSNRVVSEAHVAGAMPPQQWTCVALNVKEMVSKRHIYIQVTLYINGYECETVSLPVQGILVRKVTPSTLMVGHASRGGSVGVFHLSGVHVFRSPVLSAPTALHVTAHGPDHACQVRCETPNYPLVLTPNVLDSNIDWDQVFEISSTTLRELHDNLLLTFSAHAPNIMNLYHQTISLPTVFAGRVAPPALMAPAALPSASSGPSASIPETLYTTWTAGALASRHRGVAPALYVLGGPDVLLYLFARVVELEGSAVEQAMALGILIRACRVDNRLHAMFYSDGNLDMLLTVFAAPKCHVSHHLLKVILDEACSEPLVGVSGDSVVLCGRSDAVLQQPELLVLLARAWRHLDTEHELTWEVEVSSNQRETQRGNLWALTLCCLRVLLRNRHPRGGFNHYQMNRLGLMHHLLLACKERFLSAECGALSAAGSQALVRVVRALLGEPPLLHRLAALADFLLLMHQASDTFVTHSRANFYFLLTPDTQDMSEFCSSLNKRRSSRRPKRRPEPRPSVSSASADELTNDIGLHVLKDPVQNRDLDDRLDGSSTESSKQLKGIINTQIKESRRHNASSTSENSDVTAEGAEGDAKPEPQPEPELTEYIVVDVDDVNHTTVEMYSSGIYHQRRVRAGAAPGWAACEGLLLLLRDAIAMLPDHALHQALCGAVQAESLVVLGNHREPGVRAALVRCVAALAKRAPPELVRRLHQLNYYVHLANQISLYEGSWELTAACAALLTKCDVPLEDQLDEDIWLDVSEECVMRSPPLLAQLANCVRDVPLAHNITLLARKIIDKASLKVLSEVALVEVVIRSIREIGNMADQNFEGRDLLLEDLYELLNRVAIKALSAQHSMQTVLEIHHMLGFVELEAASEAGRGVARGAQLALFHGQLDFLERRLRAAHAAHSAHLGYFSTVLSSAVSLGSSESSLRVERGELASRHQATVSRAVAFLLTRSPHHSLHQDAPLFDRLLSTLLLAVSGASGCAGQRPRWWASGGEWAAPLQELWWWGAAPAGGARQLQPRLLRQLYHAPAPALQALAPNDPAGLRKLTVYLLSIVQHIHSEAERGPPPVELAITDWARAWAVGSQAGLPDRVDCGSLASEAQALLAQDLERWARQAARSRSVIAKVVWSKEGAAGKVTEGAMGVTRGVVELQNAQRKAFMEHLRRAHAQLAAAPHAWRALVDAYTHDQGVWHEPRSYPASWRLDEREGPGRVRVRLRRAHLHIRPRFLKPSHRPRAERGGRGGALRSVLGGRAPPGGLVARLQLNETVAYMARVSCVTAAAQLDGELLLSDRCVHFVPEEQRLDKDRLYIPEVQAAAEAQSWPLDSVTQVATRRWCLQERAVELFLSSGHAHLLAFADQHERAAFLKALSACQQSARIEPDTLTEAMSQWRSGAITNWEYLMRLNGLGGRSYNDLMQYPVLPFIIADYTSKILDLNNPQSFRDLSKPMAVQNKNREQHYINVYNDLKAARGEGCSALSRPHHYASLYSNSGGVLHYLVRLSPFTELFLNYQDNNFDMPDRTFHSLATTWRLITNDSPTDVKELIPELFYLPELFCNNEGLNLGVRQCGAPVDDVELPPWAADARLFTLVHRQALEAPHVTENLPHWIDLVFGYKQTGQAALDAINVFPACTYYGFDPNAPENEEDRLAAATMVRMYGQAPRQLLRAPHPHAAPDLAHRQAQTAVWAGVEGARWGRYCGSPALGAPAVVARRVHAGASRLHALAAPRAVAVAPRATALVALHGDAPSSGGAAGGQGGPLALVSWGHSDNIVRIKRRRDARPDLLLHIPALDQITCVATSCSRAGCPWPLVLGMASGRVLALRVSADAHSRVRVRPLHAHAHALAGLHACSRAGLLASAGADGTVVLWDLNKLTYIRTLPNRDMLTVTHVTISETLCDVATVHDLGAGSGSGSDAHDEAEADADADADVDVDAYEKDASYKYKSLVRVHTVNGKFVGSVKVCERVTSVCYSAAPEGVSVNCVACGLETGGVRLYSSWELRPLRRIPPPEAPSPLLCLAYSSDASLLVGCLAGGVVVAWEADAGARPAPLRLVPAHSLALA